MENQKQNIAYDVQLAFARIREYDKKVNIAQFISDKESQSLYRQQCADALAELRQFPAAGNMLVAYMQECCKQLEQNAGKKCLQPVMLYIRAEEHLLDYIFNNGILTRENWYNLLPLPNAGLFLKAYQSSGRRPDNEILQEAIQKGLI